MALFEFEDGRLIPAQFGRPVPGGFTPELIDAVCAQVLEIVSRPLFPITWRDLSRIADHGVPGPRLIALDATGQVVSVEVVEHLDSDTLIASLSRLAETAALSWSDLAHEYPGDIEGFKAGWLRFRDSMPPSPGSGPRLVMVVASIDPTVRPALDVLAASGVEVHEMALRQMSNGRSFLDVQAVGPRLYGHSPQVVLGRATTVPEITVSMETTAEISPGPIHEDGASAPAGGGVMQPAHPEQAEELVHSETLEEDAPLEGAPEEGAPEAGVPDRDAPEEVAPIREGTGPIPSASPAHHGRHHHGGPDLVDDARAAAEAASHSSVDRAEGESPAVVEARAQGVPVLDRNADGLRTLCEIIREDVPLVSHSDAGLPADAVLGADGLLHVAGHSFAEPNEATRVLGRPDLDGWNEWRLVDRLGPTLGESLDEINREIVREYQRIPPKRHRSRH